VTFSDALTVKEASTYLALDEITLAGGVTAIEWPDRLPRPFAGAITVRIEHVDASTRTISIE